MLSKKKLAGAVAGVSAAIAAPGAFAATIDVSSVTGAMSDASTAIATVGAAVLVVIVGAKVYKWITRAM